jgi:hypothetical protein
MTKNVITRSSLVAVSVLLATSASAEIKVNDNLSFAGYLVGSTTITDRDTASTLSTMDMDAMKLTTLAKFAPVSATLSLWSGADANPVFLDAFVSYDAGDGVTVTGGKFLSWLGYEAFDAINMTQITYAWNTVPGSFSFIGIPAYHSGVKIEKSTEKVTGGFAVLDSNNYSTPVYKGDGLLSNGLGFEAYANIKSGGFTTFIGAAYDKDTAADVATYSGNIWVQYVEGANTFAAELSYATSDPKVGTSVDTMFWQLFAKHAFSEKYALSGRIAGGVSDTTPNDTEYMKYTVAPAWTLTANLDVVAELSYVTYDGVGYDDAIFAGLQARFKF